MIPWTFQRMNSFLKYMRSPCSVANKTVVLLTRPRGYKRVFMLDSNEHVYQLLIKNKMLQNTDASCFHTLRCCIYHVNKC